MSAAAAVTTPTLIVAGITRSGLSLTMQMLHAGGCPCEGEPPAFEPHLLGCIPWERCSGKAVKLVDAHRHFPPTGEYDVIYLRRLNQKEQAKSFNKFNAAFGVPSLPVRVLVASFRRDYREIDRWAGRQRRCLGLYFEEILADPTAAAGRIAEFVGGTLDTSKMAGAVIGRGPDCLPYLLELSQLGGAA